MSPRTDGRSAPLWVIHAGAMSSQFGILQPMADAEVAQPDANWAKVSIGLVEELLHRRVRPLLAVAARSCRAGQGQLPPSITQRRVRHRRHPLRTPRAAHRCGRVRLGAQQERLLHRPSGARLYRHVDTVETNLRLAASILIEDGAVAAYESMLSGGRAQTKFMGPAYFSKCFGYRSPGVTGLRPLILDKRVATALRSRGVFGSKAGDAGRPSDLYRRYLSYCHEQKPTDPAAVEGELFSQGRSAD